ncbi:MAG TPA: hypothetical protein VFG59_15850 [Anaeromyxobacter sp.]|nr:hypothetical protein [Anaeromyxobacter sp.]
MGRHPTGAAPWAIAALFLLGAGPAGDPERPPPTAFVPAGTQPGPERGQAAVPARSLVLDGVVRSVDLAHHTVTLEAEGVEITLGLDRNTLVYLPTGLSTVFELHPGEVVRAARAKGAVAYWIQVRAPPSVPREVPATPGQGTGPGGGTPAPPEGEASPVRPGGPAPSASTPGPG